MDANAELDAALRRCIRIALGHRALDLDGATQRVDDTRELDQEPVAGCLDDPTTVLSDLGVAELAQDRSKRG